MEPRSGDLVLPQGTYVHILEGATGQVDVITGPNKTSLPETDKTVVYERESKRFVPTSQDRSIRVCPAADEGQYLVLTNPSIEEKGRVHPAKGKVNTEKLSIGRKINIPGPEIFALYPGQVADIIDGHQLKSNEYLLIRVYNEDETKENLKNAIVKVAEGENKKGNLFDIKEIRTGNLLIIKGTDVSFYIPPTGIEVLEESGKYIRKAVTLERLEYCILLDQNGDKRYVRGPSVVFPNPTEIFIENKGKRIFRATELNENMGLYLKVIADYKEESSEEDGLTPKGSGRKAGEELFLTGIDTKIYFPRAEHAIVKYGNQTIHYATAVPAGEGRYILNKTKGSVELVKGPKMLLPDPRTEVIVKRVLNDKTVKLWFPGNSEALAYNQSLNDKLEEVDEEFLEDLSSRSFKGRTKQTLYSADAAGIMADEMERKTNYTKPRSIKLDTKYEGAVLLNIWPNFAIQIVNKTGDRKVVEGPKVILLEYDETLETLELSTGKPKNDENRIKTVYLQTKNNIVSDIIELETKDLIEVDILVSYRVDFEGDSKKWFNVSDYVKLMTQHLRSKVRNAVKKISIEEFNNNPTDIIRDTVLGVSSEKKEREGMVFTENGMKIYDVEVLNLGIGDDNISEMLITNQHDIVKQNLNILKLEKDLQYSIKQEEIRRKELDEKVKTSNKTAEVHLKEEANDKEIRSVELANQIELDNTELTAKESKQKTLDKISAANLSRRRAQEDSETSVQKERSLIAINEVEKQLKAITPGLIEALITNGNVKLSETLAKNLKAQHGGLAAVFSGGGGFKEILETIKGTPLEPQIKKIMAAYKDFKKESDEE